MAIGTTTAVLGAAAIGAGGTALSARSQSRAVDRASDAQQRSTDQAIQFQRDAFNRQIELSEPFRQFGIQQANAMGELFGFDPVGQSTPQGPTPRQDFNPYDAYVAGNSDLAREYSQIAGSGFGNDRVPARYDANGDGRLDRGEYGNFHFDQFGQNEGRALPSQPGAAASGDDPLSGSPGTQSGPIEGMAGDNGINTDAQDRSRERFENSLFNDALQGSLGRAATGIDANFAASGDVYSGAREQAQQNTAADLGFSALGMYTNAMMGQPSTAGASMASNAAGAYGANSANLALGQGQNAANSAYAQGQINSQTIGNMANLAAFGLGNFGGFGGGGNGGGGQFNLRYGSGPGGLFTG